MTSAGATEKTSEGTLSSPGKGKQPAKKHMGKGHVDEEDDEMIDDEEEEDDDDEDEDPDAEGDDDDMEEVEEDTYEEIDPSVIQPRRTRGKKVDYTTPEALKKAGLKPEDMEDNE